MTKKFEVKVRFNNLYPTNTELHRKWRVIVESVEYQVDEVEIFSKSYTSQDMVKGDDGEMVEKYHISTKAKSINMATSKGITKIVLR
jgi:hypothetical protein